MQDKYLKISDLNNYIKKVFDENPYLKSCEACLIF